jgi:hypothetical protein
MKLIAMKTLSLLTALALGGWLLLPAAALSAQPDMTTAEETRVEEISAEEMMVDFFLLRPAGFLATVFGSAFFVASLPLNFATGKTKPAYEKLVISPVRYTFQRDLGDF